MHPSLDLFTRKIVEPPRENWFWSPRKLASGRVPVTQDWCSDTFEIPIIGRCLLFTTLYVIELSRDRRAACEYS